MARAGADIVVCHLGLTTGGAIGAETALKLDDCVPMIDAWAAAARARESRRDRALPRRPDRDARRRRVHPRAAAASCHGFYGASSMERLPTEVALTETTREVQGAAPATRRRAASARSPS